MSMLEQLRKVSTAQALAGAHGSSLTLMAFMPKGGCVFEFTSSRPPVAGSGVYNTFYNLAAWVGHRYASVRASWTPGTNKFAEVDVGAIMKAVLKLLNQSHP